jgi:nitrate reductase (NAD(P)H)
MGFIKKQAENAAKEQASPKKTGTIFDRHRWNAVRFRRKEQLSEDTHRYTFSLPPSAKKLDLGTCQHLLSHGTWSSEGDCLAV